MLKNKRWYLIIFVFLLLLVGGYFFLCAQASKKVNVLFADAMAKQRVLRGTVTVEELQADVWGRVSFKNLTWLDPEGEPVVFVPQGSFKVKTWDILTRQIDLDTLEELVLERAFFSLDFNERMQLDVVRYQEPQAVESKESEPKPKAFRNVQLDQRVPGLRLELQHCTLSAQYKQRYFALYDVNLLLDASTKKQVLVQLTTGPLGGQLVGDRLSLNGQVLLAKQPQLELDFTMEKVLPEAMGLRNVRNLATATGRVQGSWQEPQVEGTISFEELDIPALHFNNVKGNYHYQDGKISFEDVQAGLFGGYVNAWGVYYLDSRDYQLHAVAKKVMASLAARSTKINCKVDLDLHMDAKGRQKQVHTYGSFTAGKGSYMLIPFEGLRGEFDDHNKELKFTNVVVKTFLGDITTDAFQIVDGQLTISNLSLKDRDGKKMELDIYNK